MDWLTEDERARQDALTRSQRLGRLAAEHASERRGTAPELHATTPAGTPAFLANLLQNLRRRQGNGEQATTDLQVHEYVKPP